MALRNQPYLPLYVQDYLTDEKLNECTAATQGIYIKLMCLMHKSTEYGCILLEQKYKQSDNQILNFALKLVKHLPFSQDEIYSAIEELLSEKVLYLDDDKLCQKRMIKDNELSIIRSECGKIGGNKSKFAQAKLQANNKAKVEANAEYENENEFEFKNKNIIKKEKKEILIPSLSEFLQVGKEKCIAAKLNYSEYEFSLTEKYNTWVADGWKDGNKQKIKNYKLKIGSVLPYLKPIKQQITSEQQKTAGFSVKNLLENIHKTKI